MKPTGSNPLDVAVVEPLDMCRTGDKHEDDSDSDNDIDYKQSFVAP